MGEAQEDRSAALQLLRGVLERGEPLNDQLTRGALSRLPPAARARAQRLALSTLRRIGPADLVLRPLVRKEPPFEIRLILRMAVVELLAEGGDAHGVVDTAVSLARAGGHRTAGFAGMVNAVLRRAALLPPELLAQKGPQPLPGWLRGRLMSAYGKATTIAIERAHALGAPLDLTARSDPEALAARLGGVLLPTGSVRLTAHGQVSDLPGHAEGDWWVQDAAAALAVRALAPAPAERVFDLCAAPGGKTLQLAAAKADVTAVDASADRMARLSENLARCGMSARTAVADILHWQPDGQADAVLLDAPCSATGTIRRHPDLPFVRDASGLKPLVALQAEMIDRALAFLRPGGRLVYATCSLLPEEGERQVTAALARHPGLAVDAAAVALAGVEAGWIGAEGGLRLRPDRWPELGGMDGFYIAVLRPAG